MIAKNDEAMRSRIWKISTMVSSVLIVIIAIFLLTKLFTTNPLEGSWVNEDGSLELKVQSGGELTAVLPEFAEGGQVEVPMSYTIDKGEKTISILDNEEEMQKIATLERNNRLVKGQVFLWHGAKDWHDLWDEDGVIVK